MNIYAVIPARSGSKGVPHKNIRSLAGHPLLAWSIAAAKLSKYIERVVVSTDSEQYAEIARIYGAEVPFLRPQHLATDSSVDRDFLVHVVDFFQEKEQFSPPMLALLRPTTPLRNPVCIDEAITLFAASSATSLRSAHECSESPAKWFQKDGKYFKGLMGNKRLDLPRQQCPPAYIPNGYIDIVRSEHIIVHEDMHFPHMLAYVSPVGHEVDTVEDMEYLEYLAQKENILRPWLDSQV